MNKRSLRIAGWAIGLSLAFGAIGTAVGASQAAPIEAEAAVTVGYTSIGTASAGTETISSTSYNTLTWTVDTGISIVLHKGSGNDVYTSNKSWSTTHGNTVRMYVGNVFSVVASTGYSIIGVKLTNSTNGSYYGGNFTANTVWSGGLNNVASNDTTNLSLTNCTSTTSGQVSTIAAGGSAKNTSVNAIYFTTSKQVRASAFTISYTKSVMATGVAISEGDDSVSTIVSKTINLAVGDKTGSTANQYDEDLVATVSPNTSGNVADDLSVTWSVGGANASYVDWENKEVDDVNNEILFTISTANAGVFTITASANGAATPGSVTDVITYNIVDTSVPAVSLDKSSGSGYKGQTISLTATAKNVSPQKYIWTTSDLTAAKLGDSEAASVTVNSSETTNSIVVTLLGDTAKNATVSVRIAYDDGGVEKETDLASANLNVVGSSHSLSINKSGPLYLLKNGTINVTPTLANTGYYAAHTTVNISSSSGDVTVSNASVSSGTPVTLTGKKAGGSATITFSTDDGDSVSLLIKVANDEKTTGNGYYGKYVLCSSMEDIVPNGHYIFSGIKDAKEWFAAITDNTNNRKTVIGTVADDSISLSSTVNNSILVTTLGVADGYYTFATKNYAGTAGYLQSAASSNYLQVGSLSDNGKFEISFDNSGNVTVHAIAGGRTYVRFNENGKSDPLISCYGASTDQSQLKLYRQLTDAEVVQEFVDGYMKFKGSGAISKDDASYNESRCEANYGAAKPEYNKLDVDQKALFATGSAFVDAAARFARWAIANGDSFNSTTGVLSAGLVNPVGAFDKRNDQIALIVAVIGVGLAAAGGLIFLHHRHRKED